MAINFPDSPSNDDTFTANGKTFVYNSTDTSWRPQSAAESGGTDVLADMAALIAKTGMSNGDQALVQSTNNLYMYSGSGWYKIATIQNDAPSAITGVDGSYTLALDGTATTITAVSTDPEGFALTWSYTASGLGSIATVSQSDNVFTVTPSTDAANFGSFTLTISATDGINGAVSTIPSFTLSFSVTNSRYTALSVKATNTGSNQTFDDASASNHTITVAGDTTAATFSPYRHGGYSTYLGTQTSRYYSPSSSDFDIGGTGDWSYEAWVYADNQTFPSYPRAFGLGPFYNDPKSFGVQLSDADNSNNITVYWSDAAGQSRKLISSTAFSQEVWHHLLVCRSGNDIALFLDGTRIAHNSSYTSSIDTGNTYLYVGHTDFGTEGFMGHIRDVRFINGSHSYDASASSITVPTEPLTAITNTKFLLSDLPYFKDQSASNHAITATGNVSLEPKSVFDNAAYSEASHGASAYFDGDADYIDLNGNAEFAFDTNDFTIEFWFYSQHTQTSTICDFRGTNQNSTQTILYIDNSDNTLRYNTQSGDRITSSAISKNVWTHLALTRSGNDVRLFINGKQEGSTYTNSLSQLVGASRPRFGGSGYVAAASGSNGYNFKGYMSDIRVLNGTAVYTANFTPPTAPLTAITNTKFLLNPEPSAEDLSQSSRVSFVGNPATDTTQVKFVGTKSIAFDGTGDYLTFDIPGGDIGANEDFTVELWHRFSSDQWGGLFQVAPQILGNAHGSSIPTFAISRRTSGGRYQMYSGAGGYISAGAGQTTVGQWYHLAYVRYNGTIKIYEDGTEITALSAADTTVYTTPKGVIGGKYATGYLMFGNIQDFRFTRGLARYTADFTPPTEELEG